MSGIDETIVFSDAALDRLFSSSAFTVVGASAERQSSQWLLENLAKSNERKNRKLTVVNPKYAEVGGYPSVPSIKDVEEIGLLIFLVSPQRCLEALNDLQSKPDGVMVYSDGFSLEELAGLRAWSVKAGVPTLGPACSGIVSMPYGLSALAGPPSEEVVEGPIGLVAQSGGVFSVVLKELMGNGTGVSFGVSYGKGFALGYEGLISYMLRRPEIKAVGTYIESVTSLQSFARLGQLSQELGKPVVIAHPGTSEAGQSAAASHTGAEATPRIIYEGVAEQFGLIMVGSADELLWGLTALNEVKFRRPRVPGVGVIAGSGAAAVLVADQMERAGVPLPAPSQATRASLAEIGIDSIANPYDVGAPAMDNVDKFQDIVRRFGADDQYGILVRVSGTGLPKKSSSGHVRQAEAFLTEAVALDKVAVFGGPVTEVGADFCHFDSAAMASGSTVMAAKLLVLGKWAEHGLGAISEEDRNDPAPKTSALGDVERVHPVDVVTSGKEAQERLAGLPLQWPISVTIGQGEASSVKSVFTQMQSRLPLIVKVEAALAHRAVMGGVVAHIKSEKELEAAVSFILERFGAAATVSEQIAHGVEYLVGFDRTGDAPLLAFGRHEGKGIKTEVRLSPVSEPQLERLVISVVDKASERPGLVQLLLAFDRLCQADNSIMALDLNPVSFSGADGMPYALDAKIFGQATI